jgi:hypothetical protein
VEAVCVIPAKAGIQSFQSLPAFRVRREIVSAKIIFLKLTALGPSSPQLVFLFREEMIDDEDALHGG